MARYLIVNTRLFNYIFKTYMDGTKKVAGVKEDRLRLASYHTGELWYLLSSLQGNFPRKPGQNYEKNYHRFTFLLALTFLIIGFTTVNASVYRLCREENIAIPEWVYEYFDKYALHGTINKW